MRNKIEYDGKVISDDVGAAYRLTTGDCPLAVAPMSDALAADTLEFDVKSDDTGLTNYTRNERMTYSYLGERMGTFYVQHVGRVGVDTYRFSAISAMGMLMGKTHYGGMYTGQTVAEVVADIVADTGVAVEIKTVFRDYKLYGWLPVKSARDNLAQVLFAVGAAVKTMSDGTLRVTNLFGEPSWTRDAGRCFIGGSVDYGAPVGRVIVTEHKWEPGSETVELFNGAAGHGDIIRFSEPVHDLVANGFTILEQGCNYAKLSAGTGTLTGTKYIHNMRDIIRQVAAQGKDVTVKEAYLVGLMNSVGVTDRLAEYYKHTERVNQPAIWAGEHPGDVVRTAHPYGGMVDIMLTSVDIAMSNILRAEEVGVVGYKPKPPAAQIYYDYVEVITEDGEWTVPDGVTTITVLLIAGGDGGSSGLPGEVGEDGGPGSYTSEVSNAITYYQYAYPGLGGEGGEPGVPGNGGKVFQAQLDVTPGERFLVKIGLGGKGGTHGSISAPGEPGGPTTFGTFTSESGSSRPEGIVEVTSGITYAAAGKPGVKGGHGSGGDKNSGWTLIPGEPVEVDGVTYQPGTSLDDVLNQDAAGNYGYQYGARTVIAQGGFGGGAAAGADGSPGGQPKSVSANSNGGSSISAYGGNAGAGANAVKPSVPTNRGTGGTAGHGGGGSGSPGGAQCSARVQKYYRDGVLYVIEKPTMHPFSGYTASPGAGSDGGDGAPGAILVYYSVPKSVQSGRFLAAGKTPFFTVGRRTFAV